MKLRVFLDARKGTIKFNRGEVTYIRSITEASGLPSGFYTLMQENTGISIINAPDGVQFGYLMPLRRIKKTELQAPRQSLEEGVVSGPIESVAELRSTSRQSSNSFHSHGNRSRNNRRVQRRASIAPSTDFRPQTGPRV